MNDTSILRPAWTPAMVAIMVVGFLIKWPIGLAVLAYIIWGDRIAAFKQQAERKCNGFFANAWCRSNTSATRSGNVAFDEWQKSELERLSAERRKLDEMCAEFDAHIVELRRARDQDEFERFMDARKRSKSKSRKSGKDSGTAQQA